MQMITISLCMIVKNEERILARCLDSVKDLVDEIIIVDTGSADATRRIAQTYTDRVYDLHGSMISVQRGILLFPRQLVSIFIPQMRMRFSRKRTGQGFRC